MKGLTQQLRVTLGDDDGEFDVWTWPIDYDVQAFTYKRHPEWPTREENPVGFLLFLSWAAGRRAGLIEMSEKYETYKARVRNVEDLGQEDVNPTEPAPGAG